MCKEKLFSLKENSFYCYRLFLLLEYIKYFSTAINLTALFITNSVNPHISNSEHLK